MCVFVQVLGTVMLNVALALAFSCQKWTGFRMIMHVSVNLELDKIIITVHAVMMSTIYEQEVQCHFELLAFLSTVIQKPIWNQSLQFVH